MDEATFAAGARAQILQSIGTATTVLTLLYFRPALAPFMVVGWCVAGVWIGATGYRSALKVATNARRRKAEIEVRKSGGAL